MVDVPESYLPYSDLKRIDIEKCRRLFFSQQEKIKPEDSLIVQKEGQAVYAERLPWDSQFFGKSIAKVSALALIDRKNGLSLLKAFEQRLVEEKIAYVFGAIPSTDLTALDLLGQSGWSLIETRLHYSLTNLASFAPAKRNAVRLAQAEDVPPLQTVCVEAVNPYDRFHADPFFSRGKVDLLMREWVRASVLGGFADAVLIPRSGPSAFSTVKYGRDDWEAIGAHVSRIVLAAVAKPAFGWYPLLISESILHLREKGASHITLSTQSTNRVVVRTWSYLGFSYDSTSLIFRKVL